MDEKEIKTLFDDAAARIIEHADSVVIIVTFDGPTEQGQAPTRYTYKTGGGNYYAQVGSAAKWLEREKHGEFAQCVNPPRDDDGESWKD